MIIFVDIDDTICYRDNTDARYDTAQPYPDRIQRINQLFDEGNEIVYWTARGTKTEINWYKITHDQLTRWGAKYTELRMGKPKYDLFIDDKNINSETFFE